MHQAAAWEAEKSAGSSVCQGSTPDG
jgi:hypothetical protein